MLIFCPDFSLGCNEVITPSHKKQGYPMYMQWYQ